MLETRTVSNKNTVLNGINYQRISKTNSKKKTWINKKSKKEIRLQKISLHKKTWILLKLWTKLNRQLTG